VTASPNPAGARLTISSLCRSFSDHSNDAGRSLLRSGARISIESAAGARDAVKQLHVAAAIDPRDSQTERRTKGHRTVT